VLAVAALLAVAGLAAGGWMWWSYRSIDRVDLDLAEVQHTEPRNYLLIGSDSRENVTGDDPHSDAMLGDGYATGQRSDSIAVVRVDPDSDRLDVLSVPRDLWVTFPDGTEHRINAAYGHGTQMLVDTIAENLGIPIHHYAEVDFVGFQELVEALGGVPMYFDAPVRDPASGLRIPEAGCTVLDGPQGLAFARSRSLQWRAAEGWRTDPSGDLGRMTRQQLLMKAAAKRVRSLGVNDVGRLKGVVDAGLANTTIDSALGVRDVMGLVGHFRDFDPERLQMHSLVVEPRRTSGGAAVVDLDETASAATLAFFRGDGPSTDVTTTTVPPPSPSDITVSIHNGGAVDGEARRVSYVLTDGGFAIDEVDTAGEEQTGTTVAHAPGALSMAELVAGWLGPDPEIVEDPSLPPGEVLVVLGRSFERVAEPSEGPGSADLGGVDGDQPDPVSPNGAAVGSASATTTTVPPGWAPGVAPEGVECG